MKRRSFPLLFPAIFCLCASTLFAALLICARCGHENSEGSRFCAHCGAGFGREQEPATNTIAGAQTNGAAGPVLPPPVRPDAKVVDAELKAASGYLGKNNGWLALFYCENAMALNAIANTNKDATDRILQIHVKCEREIRYAVRECGACSTGGGRESCKYCRGSGVAPGAAGLDALKYGYGNAMKQYTVLRQGASWVPIGSAWIPPELDAKLNFRQKAVLKRIAGSRCPDCVGAGQLSCAKCAGTGRLKCTTEGCVDGQVTRRLEDGFDGSPARTMKERCKGCRGAGYLVCRDCGGYGCSLCKTCRGTGKLPVCQRCDGEGLRKCSDCRGTGLQKKNVCSACEGCGEVFCTSCMGAGRVRKAL